MPRFCHALLAIGLAVSALVAQTPGEPFFGNDLEGLRAALDREQESLGLRTRLTQALLRSGKDTVHPDAAAARVKESQAHFERILAKNPRALVPLRVQALDAYITNRFEATVTIGRRLLEINPLDAEVSRHVLKALVKLKREDEAAEFLVAELVAGTTPSFGTLQGLISNLVLNPPFRDAFGKRLDDAIAQRPNDVFLALVRALYLAELGRLESAWDTLHAAEKNGLCDTRTGTRHPFVGTLKSRSPEIGQAMPNYDGLDLEGIQSRLVNYQDHAGLAMRAARLLDLGGRTSEALAGFEAVRKLNPAYWAAYYRAGELLLDDAKAPRPKEACELLIAATGLFPAFIPGKVRAAEACARAGDAERGTALIVEVAARVDPVEATAKAMKAFEGSMPALESALVAAVAKDAGNPYLHAHLALVLHLQGKADAARAAALLAERTGLVGRDGFPAWILYQVFGRTLPNAKDPGEAASR